MSRLETLDGNTWEDFIKADVAVLLLGKTDCAACNEWTAELQSFLETDETYGEVRFGKITLDRPGLVSFKKANPWLAEVDVLPYTVIYRNGEKTKTFAGGGVERLT
ncbi:MAG: hypothetical protein AAFZ18_38500, partial [Myxococcota bacterium]